MSTDPSLELNPGRLIAKHLHADVTHSFGDGGTFAYALSAIFQADQVLHASLCQHNDLSFNGWTLAIHAPPLNEIPAGFLTETIYYADDALIHLPLSSMPFPYRTYTGQCGAHTLHSICLIVDCDHFIYDG